MQRTAESFPKVIWLFESRVHEDLYSARYADSHACWKQFCWVVGSVKSILVVRKSMLSDTLQMYSYCLKKGKTLLFISSL